VSFGFYAIHGQSFTYMFFVSGISIVMVTSSNGSETADVVDPVALSQDLSLVECDCCCD